MKKQNIKTLYSRYRLIVSVLLWNNIIIERIDLRRWLEAQNIINIIKIFLSCFYKLQNKVAISLRHTHTHTTLHCMWREKSQQNNNKRERFHNARQWADLLIANAHTHTHTARVQFSTLPATESTLSKNIGSQKNHRFHSRDNKYIYSPRRAVHRRYIYYICAMRNNKKKKNSECAAGLYS